MEDGRFHQATQSFQRATTLRPRWGLAHLQLGQALQSAVPDSPEALEALQKAVALSPRNPRAHLELGRLRKNTGDCTLALPDFKRALQLRPSLEEAHFETGLCLELQGDPQAAIRVFQALTRRNPNHLSAWATLVRLYETTQNYPLAEQAFLTLIRIKPDLAFYRYQLAQYYKRRNQPKKAEKALDEANALAPLARRKMRKLPKSPARRD
jgi:tetratricopeptide (TPR) repeat protein